MSASRLFQPLKVGNLQLKQRIAMAPLTRFRADDDHVPIIPLVEDYYTQRASVPGTLLLTEATLTSHQAGGYANVPGIYSQAHIDAWKKITDSIHKKGSYIYLQLWQLGRVADPDQAKKEGITIKSSSAVPFEGHAVPKEMTKDDIKTVIGEYVQGAKNAIAAGFDGVEVHGANGYLMDQFIQDVVNQRTDEYGGSIENRSRFAIEVTKAVVEAVGADRVGIRLSPFSDFQGMHMKDPVPQFSDVISKVAELKLAYIHLVSSRISGNADKEGAEELGPLLKLFDGPILVAGGFKTDSAKRLVDEEHPDKDLVVVFGRYFLSTPDLVYRVKNGIPFNEYDRDTFYVAKSEKGYIDYPFSKEFLSEAKL